MVKFAIILVLIGVLFHNVTSIPVLNHSLTACPYPAAPGKLVADEHIKTGPLQGIDIRIPESGLLEHSISCILVIDNGNDYHDPVIVGGGVGLRYVEIKVGSGILIFQNYRIQVYTNY